MFFSSYYDGNLNDRVDPLKLEKEIGILKSDLQGKTASNIGGWQSEDLRITDVLNYSEFIHDLKTKNIKLNRKVLAQLSICDPEAFTQLLLF